MSGSGVNNYVNKKPTQAEKTMFEKGRVGTRYSV